MAGGRLQCTMYVSAPELFALYHTTYCFIPSQLRLLYLLLADWCDQRAVDCDPHYPKQGVHRWSDLQVHRDIRRCMLCGGKFFKTACVWIIKYPDFLRYHHKMVMVCSPCLFVALVSQKDCLLLICIKYFCGTFYFVRSQKATVDKLLVELESPPHQGSK